MILHLSPGPEGMMERTGREIRTGDQLGEPGDRELLLLGLLRTRLNKECLILRIYDVQNYTGGFENE
jgi:hypothetical protein